MASFTSSSSAPIAVLLFVLLSFISTTSFGYPFHCVRHHARINSCANYLIDNLLPEKQFSRPSETCCTRYQEIFLSEDQTCLCRYLHPEKLRTSFNITRLLSLHDLCVQNSASVPLYDLCASIGYPDGEFNGIEEVPHGNLISQHHQPLHQNA
ncbi:hypothetical protein O6P43_010606 [Quillaja saponaria]|uniref:Bifunctional inhibitor/plant lipid transfer protein/seed storage helical domain-containing protein n=1 Tax=Quillaja saponaria TaxID=32244 RepID=A0AAD7Q0U1_QUISA|nr:hypothetical protein O6P43_010606 [Quillaja saponaria]